ncbi:ABC transporter substrate-binding protein [Lacrimispora sp. 210928-DFI.3.58]|uniref:ABC transporter substrate-binding protein n=1 Tax=Lacrimispora sp. 210928-DFI.3.58 TaxID=2883214 RepID=UPI001D05DA58|nr:extracellular solute-binding protein [Lacrimispora sp. 210928-DFI.3.58]MCB7317862.1 extracellular solute-binding protein [Lacrimispora sp. 210928-DFI.3.58]
MRSKKLMALAMTAIMAAAVMAGCGGKTADTGAVSQASTGEKAKEENGGKTVITVWTKDRHDAEFMQGKVDEYNATNTDNIEVKYEIYSENYPQAVDMVFQNGDAPDMFVHKEEVFQNYVNAGKFADITPFMDDEFKETFKDSLIDDFNVIDGKCYFVPTAATTCRLFYNKDIFERVGIEKAPETLQEMVDDAKLITEQLSGEGIYGFAANMKGAQSALSRSLMKQGERELGIKFGYDFKNGRYDFTGYNNLASAWKTLLSPECAFPGCESLDIDPLRTQFAAGKIGMYMSYTHAEPGVYTNQFPMEQEWGCVQLPVTDGKVVGAEHYQAMNGYLFNAESEHLEEAWKVYRAIFSNVDVLAEYYEQGYGISIVPAVIEKAQPAQYYLDNPTLLIGDGDGVYPNTPQEANVDAVIVEGQNMYETMAEMIMGDMDITQGLQDLTDRYNAALDAGIAEGSGKEIKIADFDPMNP